MTIFAKQLKQLRQEKAFSQEGLAQELFISRQAISKWETGEATPDMENLVKLATILDVNLDELVLGIKPEKKIERVVEVRENKTMNAWEFLSQYWWIILAIGGFLAWFLPNTFPKIFG